MTELESRRVSRSVVVLAALVAVLSGMAAVVGLLATGGDTPMTVTSAHGEIVELYGSGLYDGDTVFKGAGNRGSDLVTLALGVPLLCRRHRRVSAGLPAGCSPPWRCPELAAVPVRNDGCRHGVQRVVPGVRRDLLREPVRPRAHPGVHRRSGPGRTNGVARSAPPARRADAGRRDRDRDRMAGATDHLRVDREATGTAGPSDDDGDRRTRPGRDHARHPGGCLSAAPPPGAGLPGGLPAAGADDVPAADDRGADRVPAPRGRVVHRRGDRRPHRRLRGSRRAGRWPRRRRAASSGGGAGPADADRSVADGPTSRDGCGYEWRRGVA